MTIEFELCMGVIVEDGDYCMYINGSMNFITWRKCTSRCSYNDHISSCLIRAVPVASLTPVRVSILRLLNNLHAYHVDVQCVVRIVHYQIVVPKGEYRIAALVPGHVQTGGAICSTLTL